MDVILQIKVLASPNVSICFRSRVVAVRSPVSSLVDSMVLSKEWEVVAAIPQLLIPLTAGWRAS